MAELSLQHVHLQLADPTDAQGATRAWQELVPCCRSLRETLTSLRELSHFTRAVYEVAADVCAQAGDQGEALKCIRVLVQRIYPEMAARLAASTARATPEVGGNGWAGSGEEDEEDESALALPESSLSAALEDPRFSRWPEYAAAMVLFFPFVRPRAPGSALEASLALRTLPLCLLRTPHVQLAVHACCDLRVDGFVGLFRCYEEAPPLLRSLMWASVPAVREKALRVLALSYHSISCVAAARLLGLKAAPGLCPRGLLACMSAVASSGSKAVQLALEELQAGDAADLLVFKR